MGQLDDFRALSCGAVHCCGIRGVDDLYCWGRNDQGQLGHGQDADSPTPVSLGSGWDAVAAADAHTCALRGATAYCWGENLYGQLGLDGDGAKTLSPVALPPR
jgi:alpha-tubulin suppressor-like RCC1 family protein